MTGQELWAAFLAEKQMDDCRYEAWSFGADPDLLAHLVLSGEKTATASAYPLYALEDEMLPAAGEYSVILDSRDNAVCVIQTTKVSVIPFDRVTAEQAYKEGEGDRSLAYWRRVHEEFFSRCMCQAGLEFTRDMDVVFEEFTVVYRP